MRIPQQAGMIKCCNDELHLSASQITNFAALCELNDSVVTACGRPHVRSDPYLTETYVG
jgi:hypothetical protein